MHRLRHFMFVVAALAGATALTAAFTAPAHAQTWSVTHPQGGGTRASVCPQGVEGSADFLCFRLECSALEPIHFTIDLAGRGKLTEPVSVGVGVDGGDVGVLEFVPHQLDGHSHLTAAFNPLLHDDMVDLLQRGRRASLTLNLPGGVEEVPMGLTLSADSLLTAMRDCPEPVPPVDDPASLVLAEITRACADLGGTVAKEPGFERREDLDGDGREDIVIDYAAAACSASPTLNCSSGGCTVGFFLARGEGYTKFFSDAIRGYEAFPGGFLALDMHGSACGLYGFEACRQVFDIAGDAPVLAEEMSGPNAETVTIGGDAEAAAAAADGAETAAEAADGAVAEGAAPVVVAESDGVTVTPEAAVDAAVEAATAVVEEVVTEAPAVELVVEAPPVTVILQTGEPAEPAADVVSDTSAEPAAPVGEPAETPATETPAADAPAETPAPAAEPASGEAAVTETPAPADGAADGAVTEVAPASEAAAVETGEAADSKLPAAGTPSGEAPVSDLPVPDLPASEAPVAEAPVPPAAMEMDPSEGPTSRHMTGPAPALPEGARFRGDGTLIKPEDEAE